MNPNPKFSVGFATCSVPRFNPAFSRQSRPGQSSSSGFTLTEVAIAIGIVAFALIPLLGLIPIGAKAQRAAIEDTTLAQIQQAVVGELQRAEFDQIKGLKPTDIWFDDQGNRIPDPSTAPLVGTGSKTYQARVAVEYPVRVSGVSQDDVDNYNMLRAQIDIAFNPGEAIANPFADDSVATVFRRFAVVAKASK